jgi:hypothetical protein
MSPLGSSVERIVERRYRESQGNLAKVGVTYRRPLPSSYPAKLTLIEVVSDQ